MTRDLTDFELATDLVAHATLRALSDRIFQHAANSAQIEDTPCDGHRRSTTL